MYEEFWYLFTETGNVRAYLAYKSLLEKAKDGKDEEPD